MRLAADLPALGQELREAESASQLPPLATGQVAVTNGYSHSMRITVGYGDTFRGSCDGQPENSNTSKPGHGSSGESDDLEHRQFRRALSRLTAR